MTTDTRRKPCLDCSAPVMLSSTRCKSCSAKHKYATPGTRQKMREAKLASLERNPAQRAALIEAGRKSLARVHARNRNNPDFARAQRVRALVGIPEHRWDEYKQFSKRVGARDARRIILEDEQVQARRNVAQATDAMRAKHEREQAQAY